MLSKNKNERDWRKEQQKIGVSGGTEIKRSTTVPKYTEKKEFCICVNNGAFSCVLNSEENQR